MIGPGLAGKVAIVTGANNPLGIGAAIAVGLVAQGAAVFLTYLREPPEQYGLDPDLARTAADPGNPFYRAHNRHTRHTFWIDDCKVRHARRLAGYRVSLGNR